MKISTVDRSTQSKEAREKVREKEEKEKEARKEEKATEAKVMEVKRRRAVAKTTTAGPG